jgi:DNA gyrase/topoisomerase IV subunit A
MSDTTAPSNITPISIETEMRNSFMDYAMSVIVARALPDARDGLKPVHRRILFAQKGLNNVWNRPYLKCARIGQRARNDHAHGVIHERVAHLGFDRDRRDVAGSSRVRHLR